MVAAASEGSLRECNVADDLALAGYTAVGGGDTARGEHREADVFGAGRLEPVYNSGYSVVPLQTRFGQQRSDVDRNADKLIDACQTLAQENAHQRPSLALTRAEYDQVSDLGRLLMLKTLVMSEDMKFEACKKGLMMISTKRSCLTWILLLSLAWVTSACGTSREMVPVKSSVAKVPNAPAQPAMPFAGVWAVKWCEEPATPDRSCGGFRAYLSQKDSRICGTYGGIDQRANRLDEGEPRSIIGTVVDTTAVLAIASERSRGIYLVTAKLDRDSLEWDIVGVVKEGANGEPALIADGDMLIKSSLIEDLSYLDEVTRDCTSEGSGHD